MQRMIPVPDGPATNLDDLYITLRPEPLETAEELMKFYRPEVTALRGEDTVKVLSRKLRQAFGAVEFKAFLMGHPGVGKSTELSRLVERVRDQHTAVKLSIATELNPASFKVFDVLLLMLIRLAEEADRLALIPPEDLVPEIAQWVTPPQIKETDTHVKEAGAGAKLSALFVSGKGEMRYSAERKQETIQYRLQRLPDLVNACNRLIDRCNLALRADTGKEWLLVVEDLDKTVISPQLLRELFIEYGSVFQGLRVKLIFTIPVWLACSPEANQLPRFEKHMINDTPVFRKNHDPHPEGRAAIQAVLEARASTHLFAEGQMTRLIESSGGNLRDLFTLVTDAGDKASLRDPPEKIIGPDDATAAINKMRREYRNRLGVSPYDANQIPYSDKLTRLLAVYWDEPDNQIPDAILHSLFRGRAVQQFNGSGWLGVHPLVVDILKADQHLKPQDPGGTS